MRLCVITCGILYILTAVWTFANKGVAFIALAFVFGVVMLVEGAIAFLAYFRKCRRKIHLSYILSDGIIALLLGAVVITNRLVTDVEVPLLFGLWLMFSGTTRIITSFNIGRRRTGMRKYVFILGFVDILYGVYILFNSILLTIPNIVLVSVCFLLQGINVIAAGIEMPKPAEFYNKHKNTLSKSKRRKERKARKERIEKAVLLENSETSAREIIVDENGDGDIIEVAESNTEETPGVIEKETKTETEENENESDKESGCIAE